MYLHVVIESILLVRLYKWYNSPLIDFDDCSMNRFLFVISKAFNLWLFGTRHDCFHWVQFIWYEGQYNRNSEDVCHICAHNARSIILPPDIEFQYSL